ncbi:MAG: hypothetical protein AB1671_07790 [Thermodesulfobacteriota bacterium]|jgi:hypothetical protein
MGSFCSPTACGPPRSPVSFSLNQLQDLGFLITSINYNQPDYVEYEVVKGDETFEIQITMDPETDRATAVDVTGNLWQSYATDWALEHTELREAASIDAPDYILVIAPVQRFSDRDRNLSRMLGELERLPVGRDQQFYRNALQRRGYRITDTDVDENQVRFEAQKNGREIALTVNFEDEAREDSTAVFAYPIGETGERASRSERQARAGRQAQDGE